jgi:hypothetical protein
MLDIVKCQGLSSDKNTPYCSKGTGSLMKNKKHQQTDERAKKESPGAMEEPTVLSRTQMTPSADGLQQEGMSCRLL